MSGRPDLREFTRVPPSTLLDGKERRILELRMGTVYLIGFAHYVKIGWTAGAAWNRILGMQTGCPEKLIIYAELLGSEEDEEALHRKFASLRLQGEWFRNEGELAAWIEGGCEL